MAEVAGSRARVPRAVLVAAAGTVLFHLVLGALTRAPTIHPDEAAYLGTAHYFAFGHGLLVAAAPYSPGYGLLLTPFSRFLGGPLATYHAALVVNAFLLGSVVLTGYALARRVVGADETRAVVGAVLVALFGSFLLVGNLALASSLFIAMTFLAVLAVVWAWEGGRWWQWSIAGALGASLVAVHPVGVVVVISVFLASLFGARRDALRATGQRVGGVVVGIAPLLLGAVLLIRSTRHATSVARFVGARGAATGGAQSRVGYTFGQIQDALQLHNLRGLVVEAAGQLLYLTVATLGLFLIGMLVAVRAAPRAVRDPECDVRHRLAALGGLMMLGAFAASVLVINPARTVPASALLYGRYNEQVVGVVLLLGILTLPDLVRDRARLVRAVLVVIGVVVVCALVVLVVWPGARDLEINELNDMLGVFALVNGVERLGEFRLVWLLPIMCVTAVVGFLAIMLAQRLGGTRVMATVVGLAFVVPATFAGIVLVRAGEGRARERTLVAVMERQLHGAHCVGYLPGAEGTWWLANYQFFLPDVRFRAVSPTPDDGASAEGCSDLVLALPDDPAVADLGLEPIAAERVPEPFPITLYRSPR